MSAPNLRLQKITLRIAALVALPVLPALLLPKTIAEKLSWIAGFGQPPDLRLLSYVTSGGSFIYLGLSVFFWIMSGDVTRYRPLISATAWICLTAVPFYVWLDWSAGMPRWWVLMDSLSCLIAGLVLRRALGREGV